MRALAGAGGCVATEAAKAAIPGETATSVMRGWELGHSASA